MKPKILIIVPTYERWDIARRCLENLAAMKAPQDELVIFDDFSPSLDPRTLKLFSDKTFRTNQRVGIDTQRKYHFQFAANRFREDVNFSHLYLTDSDALHDPQWREKLLELQDQYNGSAICGYNTAAHACLEGNTFEDDPTKPVIWRKYAPGISYLLTRDHVDTIAPRANQWTSWDWAVPEMLGHTFLTSRISYCDHVGFGGLHHPTDENADGGDRATNPTDFLVRKRAEVIAELQNDRSRPQAD